MSCFQNIHFLLSPTVCVSSSHSMINLCLPSEVLLSAITAAIVAIITWCNMKKRYKHPSGYGMQDDKSGTHGLTSVVQWSRNEIHIGGAKRGVDNYFYDFGVKSLLASAE